MTKTKKSIHNLSITGKKTKKRKGAYTRLLYSVKPNIYARNFRYADNENLADDGITRITQALKPTQWLRVTSTRKEDDYKYKQGLSMKPEGLWYSKGEWLFHDIHGENGGGIDNKYLILVEINPDSVYEIRNRSDAANKLNNMYDAKYEQFIKDYVSYFNPLDYIALLKKDFKSKKGKLSTDTLFKGGRSILTYQVNWRELSKKYNGFAIYPYPPLTYYGTTPGKLVFPASWDVSSLVLWNKKPVVGKYNLGKVSQLKNGDFVENIVAQINKINGKL
jgi:hypothetical protein